jgi:methyl-accepting chemotaxis protein
MRFLHDLSIRNKLVAAFAISLCFTAGLGVFSVTRVRLLSANSDDLLGNVVGMFPLSSMARDPKDLAALAARGAAAPSPAQLERILAAERAVEQDYEAQWKAYVPTMDPGEETADGRGFNAAWGLILGTTADIAAAARAGNTAREQALLGAALDPEIAAFDKNMNADLQLQVDESNSLGSETDGITSATVVATFAVLAVAALATVLVGWIILRSVSGPVAAMTAAMRRIAVQEFDVAIPGIGRRDEIGDMATAVHVFRENGKERLRLEQEAARMSEELERRLQAAEATAATARADQDQVVRCMKLGMDRLAQGDLVFRLVDWFPVEYKGLRMDYNQAMETLGLTMRTIAVSAASVRANSGEITQAADDLSRRTEQAAATLEQTAAAFDSIAATVRKAADNANMARAIVQTAAADARHSGEAARETMEAMTMIDESSRKINNIVGVIDEIAFQTNLLALNAGVEAARAGDAGRGFAVVATEVRALAQRSATAAKEIKALISASGEQVAVGVRLVEESGKAFGRTVEQVTRLDGLVSEIAGSAQEQATALAEINTAMGQMDKVTQQNAAMVEQTTNASHGLARDANELGLLVGKFKVAEQPPKGVSASGWPPGQHPASRPGPLRLIATAAAERD